MSIAPFSSLYSLQDLLIIKVKLSDTFVGERKRELNKKAFFNTLEVKTRIGFWLNRIIKRG